MEKILSIELSSVSPLVSAHLEFQELQHFLTLGAVQAPVQIQDPLLVTARALQLSLGGEEVVHLHPVDGEDPRQHRQVQSLLAVLDPAQVRLRDAHALGHILLAEPAGLADLPQPLADKL